jgi:hypothetical protein
MGCNVVARLHLGVGDRISGLENQGIGEGMKLKDQAMFANLAIFAGMVVAYFQGFSILFIVGCGVLAFVLVSAFFLYRIKRARRQGEGARE